MADESIDTRKKYIEAWNKTMIDIWQERIHKLKVEDTGALWRSPLTLPVRADGRFYDITLSQNFLEYGLWQDLGVGREVPHGNPGDISCKRGQSGARSNYAERSRNSCEANIGRDKKRERRRWFSVKYYSSVMALRDFMADSLGDEFKSMFCGALDSDVAKRGTAYYKKKGWS